MKILGCGLGIPKPRRVSAVLGKLLFPAARPGQLASRACGRVKVVLSEGPHYPASLRPPSVIDLARATPPPSPHTPRTRHHSQSCRLDGGTNDLACHLLHSHPSLHVPHRPQRVQPCLPPDHPVRGADVPAHCSRCTVWKCAAQCPRDGVVRGDDVRVSQHHGDGFPLLHHRELPLPRVHVGCADVC